MSKIAKIQPNEILESLGFRDGRRTPNFAPDFEHLYKDVKAPEDNANKREVFTQNSVPESNYQEGDLWFDTDNNNHIYRASESLEWVSMRDGTIFTGNWSEIIDDDGNKPDDNATYGADWNANLLDIPDRHSNTATLGLNLTDNYLGYYDGSVFQSYIRDNGNFQFRGDGSNYINWDGSSLNVVGNITIQGGSGLNNLTDAGDLATKDEVGASDCDTTIISGGKIITGLLTADNIQTGTITIDPDNSKVEALTVKNGGDIFLEGDDTNPAKVIFRNPTSPTKKWDLYMDTGTSAEFLYLLPNNLTYRDFFVGKYNTSGATDSAKTENMLRNFFVNTGNTLSSGSRPSIIFQNWNAYGDYWSAVRIGDSDTQSVVEIQGNLLPSSDDTYNIGSSSYGWERLYLGSEGVYLEYNSSVNYIGVSSGADLKTNNIIYFGLSKYTPQMIYYKDHDGNNQSRQVLAYDV